MDSRICVFNSCRNSCPKEFASRCKCHCPLQTETGWFDNTSIMNKLIISKIISTRFPLFEALKTIKFRTMRSYPVRFSLHSLHFTAVDFEHAQIAILLEFVAICKSLSWYYFLSLIQTFHWCAVCYFAYVIITVV